MADSEDSDIPPSEISIEKQKAHGRGLRCKRYKSAVTVTHRPSATTVSATSDLSPEEASPLVEDLLHSELAYRQRLEAEGADPGSEEAVQVEDIIRKYTLRPRPSVRDTRTGVTLNNVNDLWKGAIDEFLYAALRARNETAVPE